MSLTPNMRLDTGISSFWIEVYGDMWCCVQFDSGNTVTHNIRGDRGQRGRHITQVMGGCALMSRRRRRIIEK